MHLGELRLGDVRPDIDCVEVGDLVERLAGLHDLAGPRVGREHGACDRILHLALADPLVYPGHLRVHGVDLLGGGLALRARRVDLLAVSGNLVLLSGNLLVLRLELLLEYAQVALGLIELLRGGRLLIKEPLGAVIGAPRHVVLGVEPAFCAFAASRCAAAASRCACRTSICRATSLTLDALAPRCAAS